MFGRGMKEDDIADIQIMIDNQYSLDARLTIMDEGSILLVGVGGVGCKWSENAHSKCQNLAELLLIDSDSYSFNSSKVANILHLDHSGDAKGFAALPNLASFRFFEGFPNISNLIIRSELVILLTALGGGTGSGASIELARKARESGSMVISIVGLPFIEQPLRCEIAKLALPELERNSDLCVRVSLERLAWHARESKSDWISGSRWIADLVEGIVTTLAKVGKLNLDLMDLRTIVDKPGESTMIVANGDIFNPSKIVLSATKSPLFEVEISGAKGCLIQVEGGPDMTLSHLNELTEEFISLLDDDCQVILGARASNEMTGKLRLVAVVSGIN